jgi:peroxiredoxin
MSAAFYRLLALACFIGAPMGRVAAAPADEAWAKIIALDAGPQTRTRSDGEARLVAIAHLDHQEGALRKFVAEYGSDSRAFEARLRLARLLQIRGDVEGNSKCMVEATQLLDELEKRATAEQKPEIDFARVTYLMRTLRKPTAAQRERLLNAARRFQFEHPTDRRVGPVLAEVATLFAAQPQTMRSLLNDAQALVTDPQLKAQISDDLKRIDLMGQPLPLRLTTLQKKTFDLQQQRGTIVIIAFFAVWSPPSIAALETIRAAAAKLPAESVRVLGVSLDAKTEPLYAMLKEKSITWPIGYDGKGWESPLIRALAINALPTVWLIDKHGRLRSLDALEDTVSQAQQLLREK